MKSRLPLRLCRLCTGRSSAIGYVRIHQVRHDPNASRDTKKREPIFVKVEVVKRVRTLAEAYHKRPGLRRKEAYRGKQKRSRLCWWWLKFVRGLRDLLPRLPLQRRPLEWPSKPRRRCERLQRIILLLITVCCYRFPHRVKVCSMVCTPKTHSAGPGPVCRTVTHVRTLEFAWPFQRPASEGRSW